MMVGQNCLTSGVEWTGLDVEMSLTIAVGQSHSGQGGLVVDLLELGGHLAAGAGQLVEG